MNLSATCQQDCVSSSRNIQPAQVQIQSKQMVEFIHDQSFAGLVY